MQVWGVMAQAYCRLVLKDGVEPQRKPIYMRLKLTGMFCTDLRRAISRAWSRVILTWTRRWPSTEERGVCAGEVAAEPDWFLLDLRDMAIVLCVGLRGRIRRRELLGVVLGCLSCC